MAGHTRGADIYHTLFPYVSRLAQNLRETATIYSDATLEVEKEGIYAKRALFHLSRGRDMVDLAHAHLAYTANVLEGEWNGMFEDFPGVYDDWRQTVLTMLTFMALTTVIYSMLFCILHLVHRANHKKIIRAFKEAAKDEREQVLGELRHLSNMSYLYDRRASDMRRDNKKDLAKLGAATIDFRAKVERSIEEFKDYVVCDFKSRIAEAEADRNEAQRLHYISSAIPVLLGARGNTPNDKLRNAAMCNFEFPVIDQDQISEILGFPCPPDLNVFTEQDADNLVNCFFPGARPHGGITFSYQFLGRPPLPPKRLDDSNKVTSNESIVTGNNLAETPPPSLTESDSSSQESLGLKGPKEVFSSTPEVARCVEAGIPLDTAVSENVESGTSDYDEKTHLLDVASEDEHSGLIRVLPPPWTTRSCQEMSDQLEELLKKKWWTKLALDQITQTNTNPLLSLQHRAGGIAKDPFKNRDTRKPFSYKHWEAELDKSLPTAARLVAKFIPIAMCEWYIEIAPELRAMFTTDQDTSCRRIHVNDSVCMQCRMRVLCPRVCHYCCTAIDLEIQRMRRQKSLSGSRWPTAVIQDVLYYQLLFTTQYPAAEGVVFPLQRLKDDEADCMSVDKRLFEMEVSRNALMWYNEEVWCEGCNHLHIVKKEKTDPSRTRTDNDLRWSDRMHYWSDSMQDFTFGTPERVPSCPADAFDKVEIRPFGHYLGFQMDADDEKHPLREVVQNSLRCSHWFPHSSDGNVWLTRWASDGAPTD